MEADETFHEFLAESLEVLNDCEDEIAELEIEQENGPLVDSLFRNYHSIKGSAGMLGLLSLEKMAHSIEDLLNNVRQGETHVDDSLKELLVEGNDALEGLIVHVGGDKADCNLLTEEEDLINRIRSFDKGGYSPDDLLCSFLKDIKEIIPVESNRTVEPEACQKIFYRIDRLDRDYSRLATSEQGGGEHKDRARQW